MVKIFRHIKSKNIILLKYFDEISLEDALFVQGFYRNNHFDKDSVTLFFELSKDSFLVDSEFISKISEVGTEINGIVKSRNYFGLQGIQKSFLREYQELRNDSTENDFIFESKEKCEEEFNYNFDTDFVPFS